MISSAVIEEVERIKYAIENRVNDIRVSVHETLVMQGKASPFVNQSKAYRMFGRTNVTNWENWGLIERIKDGEGNGQVRYDLAKLLIIAEKSNRCEYFKNKVV